MTDDQRAGEGGRGAADGEVSPESGYKADHCSWARLRQYCCTQAEYSAG